MRRAWPYLILLGIAFTVLYKYSEKQAAQHIDWSTDYSGRSKIPFGCYITRTIVPKITRNDVTTVSQTIYRQIRASQNASLGMDDSTMIAMGMTETLFRNVDKTAYVFINSEFKPSALDVVALCHFVEQGNVAFISAHTFGMLSDTLGVKDYDFMYADIDTDSALTLEGVVAGDYYTPQANLVHPKFRLDSFAIYHKARQSRSFYDFDTTRTLVLGVDGHMRPNYIKVQFGNGHFLLHKLPEAFSNYYLSEKLSGKYAVNALRYLPPMELWFDEYYKDGYVIHNDSRRYMLSEPALKLAYFIAIIFGGLVLLFGGKRMQRPVPVVKPLNNATLDFVEQIGALYYRQNNHHLIIQKKINYFLESIRSRFYVQTNVIDNTFVERISNLSGVTKSEVDKLFRAINYLKDNTRASETDLKNLERAIWGFNQKSKR
jgi:hypothetical protein